jgi:hypothetical protein
MPIRSIDYRNPKIKGPVKSLKAKSSTLYLDNSFVFSDNIEDWHSNHRKDAGAKFYKENSKKPYYSKGKAVGGKPIARIEV